jgi:hypothetical protein
LAESRRRLELEECEWLAALADFDRAELWRGDGHACGASWLVAHCRMARSTAFEKLRVAHELTRRPLLADAFAAGDVSYSQVRAIATVTDGGVEYDAYMLDVARSHTADEVQQAAEHWDYLRNQDRPPPDLYDRRRMRRCRGFGGGLGRLIIDDTDENLDRLENLLDAFIDADHRAATRRPVDESAAQTEAVLSEPVPVDESAAQTDAFPMPTRSQRRLDALNDMIEVAAACEFDFIDVERAAIGVTIAYESLISGIGAADLSRGRVITAESVRRLACDAGIHRMITRGRSEVLDAGRKTRAWSPQQRRTISARHRHQCAVHGCHRRIVEIHHIEWWENGGATSIGNGVPLCLGHHHLVHEGGWTIAYDGVTGVVTLTAPRGDRRVRSDATFGGSFALVGR